MSELTTKIRSRGHWLVVIRPQHFDETTLPYEELADIVYARQVRMRGWYFPHVKEPFERGRDYVGNETQFAHHLEAWRFFTSAQFIDVVGFGSDWRDESTLHPAPRDWAPSTQTPVWESLFRFTEFFEFAARLALLDVYASGVTVRLETHGLRGRALVVDDPRRAEFFEPYVASIESHTFEKSYRAQDLVASAREEAVSAARDLYLRFGWTGVTADMLADYQQELTTAERR